MSTLSTQDAELAQVLASGDPQALSELIFRRYGDGLIAFLVDRMPSRAEAEELLWGAVAERVVRGIRGYRGEGSLRAWVYVVARNARNDYFRARLALDTTLTGKALAQPLATTPSQRPLWQRTDTKQRLRELRRRLSEGQQDVLFLHLDRGFSFPEVAEYLNGGEFASEHDLRLAAASARQTFQRAKARLRTWMKRDTATTPEAGR